MVRLPSRARWRAVTPAITVLPTPPLPPKNMNFILGCAATNSVKLCVISPIIRSLSSIAVHDFGQFLDHRQPGYVALEFRNASDDLLAEDLVNLLQVLALHP